MKTVKLILAVIAAVLVFGELSAQEQYLHLYKGGSWEKSYRIASIDSALFDDSSSSNVYLDLYCNGRKHRAADIAELDSFKIGGELKPSGIYMGIIGFNQALYEKEISSLSSSSKSAYTSFVSNLSSSNGTVLYYAVDNALDAIKEVEMPEDLVNVSVITFTDGLDQGSIMLNTKYTTNSAYLSAVNSRIKSEKVKGIPITAYSIGLRGNDVTDVAQFQANLKSLASSDANAIEVSDISEVNAKFNEIANDVYNESSSSTVGLTIPGQSDGTRIRFTFDDVSSATSSSMYIEGVFRLSDRTLTDVKYVGLSSESGSKIVGVQSGIYVTFTFEGLKSMTSYSINASYIDQWSYITSSSKWQINSEFTPDNNTTVTVSRKTALIMLVLDCSSSLGSQFSTVKTQATNFISKLAGYGNDSKFTAIDIDNVDIFDSLSYDEMVKVEGGTFTMGATAEQGSDYDSDELPTHQVTLSDYYIGKYEVTQQLWEYVMSYSGTCADGSSMSAYASDVWLGSDPSSSYGVGDYYPAYYVSYYDIVDIFLPRLNKITGRTYRLPTEAEWEFAARGGKQSKGYKYSGSDNIGVVAWYTGNNGGKTHQVGTKEPNELGIYDMSGNVWEWCGDWYGSYSYSSSAQTNPTGPSSGSRRVLRGGSWHNDARFCRVSFRNINYFLLLCVCSTERC